MPAGLGHPAIFWIALLVLAFIATVLLEAARGVRLLERLDRIAPIAPGDAPPISVVIAARNEASSIEQALRSVLRQEYPKLEVVVVDDRSSDGTGGILRSIAEHEPRLRVVHITGLPEGWLGKNHALHLGAADARGEYILFTDADVVLDPTTLGRAIAYMRSRGIDHLAAGPGVELPTRLLRLFVVVFTLFFTLYTRPWKARDPHSAAHIGIGAFNLVRTDAYRAAGGHAPIAMRPDDDLKLGKLLKREGFRQDFVAAGALVRVEWYASFPELVRGLMKNGFSGVEYRLSRLVLVTGGQILFTVVPWVAVWFTAGATQLLFAATMSLHLALFAAAAREQRVNPLYGVGFPVASLLLLYILWRAAISTLVRGGIEWRGTHYPLAALRANRV
ncbi:MAG: glycosyltransferase [Gemmatimonadota bacterium]|nr:glycosyltransferase [Gemmatimonadota bacterium]